MARLPMVPETAVPAAMHRVVKGETELTTTLQALFAVPEVASRLVDLDDLAYDAALANVDVLVMPTCIMTAPQNNRPGSYLEAVEENLATMNSSGSRNTLPFNYTGHPALALPVGRSSAGLPVSMQLVGRFFDDPLLMRAAYAYQQSTDWDKIIGVQS